MKIVILGAGQVGGTLAENLVDENSDITVIDSDRKRLQALQSRLDINTVVGEAAYPHILSQAGCDEADMLIAVTNSDETNMLACQIAHTLFKTPTIISRVRSNAYNHEGANLLSEQNGGPIHVVISPEKLVTNHISRLLTYPGSLQVLDFADDRVQLTAVRAGAHSPLVGNEIKDLKHHLPNTKARVAAVFRDGEAIVPYGDTKIKTDDEVFFVAATNDIKKVMRELRREEDSYKRIIIAGGGNIGYRLAKTLENKYQIKLIEHNGDRGRYLSEKLSKTVVLLGSANDRALLEDENMDRTDVFCAVTDDDEVNIMSSLLAKRLGVRKVLTLVNNPAYVDLVRANEINIDILISPQHVTIGKLLAHIRQGATNVHALRRGAAEAIEVIAHGTKHSSKVVGRAIKDIDFPQGTVLGAVVRDDNVIMASSELVIESEDHAILFVMDKKNIHDVEQLFYSIDFF